MRLCSATAVLACLATGLAVGCRPAYKQDATRKDTFTRPPAPKGPNTETEFKVTTTANKFIVDAENGDRILEARVENTLAEYQQQKGLERPIRFENAKCKLFQKGKFQMSFDTPECFWDGEQIKTDKTAHSVSADGSRVIDAQKMTWTSATGHVDLVTTTLQSLKDKKLNFTARAPVAEIRGDIATMPAGGEGWNPLGQRLTGKHIRWDLKINVIDARGNVVVTTAKMTVSGDHLKANTELEEGAFTGACKMVAKQTAFDGEQGAVKKPGAGGAGKGAASGKKPAGRGKA